MHSSSWYRHRQAEIRARQHQAWMAARRRGSVARVPASEAAHVRDYDALLRERDDLRAAALIRAQEGEHVEAELAERAAIGRDQQAIDRYPALYRRFRGNRSGQS